MFRQYRWILCSMILLLVSSVAFAASSSGDITLGSNTPSVAAVGANTGASNGFGSLGNISNISSTAVTNQTDLSVNFLDQIFGTVGNVLTGTSGQMLGKLFYDFNVGILVVASIWLCYSVVSLLLGSASEGSFMGRQGNVAFAFLRIAIGMGALVPSPTTGYCIVQDIAMEVVVQGVALADMVWSSGINYIQSGGSVWRAPVTSSDGASLSLSTAQVIFNGKNNTATDPNAVAQVFIDEVCMDMGSMTNGTGSLNTLNSNNNANNNSIANTGSIPPVLEPIDNYGTTNTFDFPSSSSNTTGCGSISWPSILYANNTPMPVIKSSATYAYQAMYQVVYGMLSAAKEYACTQSFNGIPASTTPFCQGTNTNTMPQDVIQSSFSNLLAYVNAITPLMYEQANQAGGDLTNFLNTLQSEGWLSAGRYSWDITHLQDTYHNLSSYESYLPASSLPVVGYFTNVPPNGKSATTKVDNDLQSYWTCGSPASSGSCIFYPYISDLFNSYTGGSEAGNGGSVTGGDSGLNKIEAQIFGGLPEMIAGLEQLFAGNNIGDDPLYLLHRVGLSCLGLAGYIWLYLAGIVATLYGLGAPCQAILNLDAPIGGVVDWIKPILFGVAGVFIATGGVLAFYVPIYSFLIFTFAVIGWFIAVIEAIVCAPMIAFGLTHPEGHDLLGSAKQSLILLLGIFVRPALIIIGLIGGMILSFVSFRFLNYGFGGFMHDIYSSSQHLTGSFSTSMNESPLIGMQGFLTNSVSGGGGGMGSFVSLIIGMPVLIMIYTGAAFFVANQAYSLIYVLPDYVLRWIGGQQQNSGIGQMVEGLKGGVSDTTKGMASGLGESMVGTGRGKNSIQQGKGQLKAAQAGEAEIGGGSSGSSGSGSSGSTSSGSEGKKK